jgi:hypothetical protein
MKIQKSCRAVDDRHLLPMNGEVSAEWDYADRIGARVPARGWVRRMNGPGRSRFAGKSASAQARSYTYMRCGWHRLSGTGFSRGEASVCAALSEECRPNAR